MRCTKRNKVAKTTGTNVFLKLDRDPASRC